MEVATWFSSIVIVPKNNNGKFWICVNFGKLNVTMKKDSYPLLFTNEVFNIVIGCKNYSFWDGFANYHQISTTLEYQ